MTVVGLLIGAAPGALVGQRPAAEIRVSVKDQLDAPMRVTGTLRSLSGNVNRQFETDAQGRAVVSDLPYGRYRLQLTSSGFASQSELIDLQSPTPIERAIVMALGTTADRVDVVAPTPLGGVGLTRDEFPAPVQTVTSRDLDESGAVDLSDFLHRRLNGIYINSIQGNPYQPDVNYRGYTASPLLGTPQGLSIYMDGVRINQPFGDVVGWDLIPRNAIAEVALIPGSNPLFGLNTLGGALSLDSKDGRSHSGTAATLKGGSFGRKQAELEHGGSTASGYNWFLAGSFFFEDGWRQASPSNVRQFFSRLGRQFGATSLSLSLGYANNSLTGNGLQELRLLERDYSSYYTKPDITDHKAPFVTLAGRHSLSSRASISGNAYYRQIGTSTLNGDMNEASLDQAVYQPSAADIRALTNAGYTGFPSSGANAGNTPFPYWRCIAQALQGDEPAEKCNGVLNRTRTRQHNYGFSAQIAGSGTLNSARHQFTAGAAFDASRVSFIQTSQLGYIAQDRSIVGVNAFGDGVTGGTVDGEPYDTRANLRGSLYTGSMFAADTITAGRWNVSASGRFNRTTIDNYDRIQPLAGPGSLTGRHVFSRFNPAAGLTYNAGRGVNTYFGYSEGSRAPTSIELGCADPSQPCRLPNALVGDPPLRQVITRTLEAGIRGGSETRLNWSAGWFYARNTDDILFVASTQTGFGYFKNFGRTRREGAEVSMHGRVWRLSMGGNYTFLEATYESAETVFGVSNSFNDLALAGQRGLEGVIGIRPGNRIPLIPQHMLKAYSALQATRKVSMHLDLVAMSSSYARGNENNLSQADGSYYLGPGTSPGYAVVNLGIHYDLKRRIQLFAQVNNLLNRRYYTAAQLGPTGLTENGTFIARPLPSVNGEFPLVSSTFYAPGAPLGAWGGLRVRF